MLVSGRVKCEKMFNIQQEKRTWKVASWIFNSMFLSDSHPSSLSQSNDPGHCPLTFEWHGTEPGSSWNLHGTSTSNSCPHQSCWSCHCEGWLFDCGECVDGWKLEHLFVFLVFVPPGVLVLCRWQWSALEKSKLIWPNNGRFLPQILS